MDLIEKLIKIETKAKKHDFVYENYQQIIDQIKSECDEVAVEVEKNDRDALKEELGDVIIAAMALAYYLNCDIKECMELALDKFETRLDKALEFAENDGITSFKGLSMDEILKYWKIAKNSLK
ncbi:MAG: hypothetical protein J0G32_01840 [Alphaproteobacteria bacterium]|nr:hypothetical protein [Alphaproteobacteria bacterium]OJV15355.1 MAG: hypothetical protein BGO27_02480 [Alphaproteobacteria bacterium 33-17]